MISFKKHFRRMFYIEETLLKEDNEKPVDKSIYNDDVRKAFLDFVYLDPNYKNNAIIGGIAYSTYTTPRNTQDVDFVVDCEAEMNYIFNKVSSKFKKIRPHTIEHKGTGVEFEFITADLINSENSIIDKAIETAKIHDVAGSYIKVVNPKMLVALKLGRASNEKNVKSLTDQGDILNILLKYPDITMDDLELPKEHKELFEKLKSRSLNCTGNFKATK